MSRYRDYVFTVNNYTEEDECQVYAMPWEVKDCRYIVVGKETGESGTPHLQGYISFHQPKSLKQLREWFPTAHFENRKGTPAQASDYCKKDGDYFEWGTLPMDNAAKGAAGAAAMEQLIADTMEAVRNGDYKAVPAAGLTFVKAAEYLVLKEQQQERNLDVLQGDLPHEWYYGLPGTGKSKKAREENPGAYLKMCNKWWDGYTGQDVVIIEDFDPDHKCLVHHLKIWGDRYPFPCEIKGGKLDIRPTKVIVTSNYHPREIFERQQDCDAIMRRFKVVHFLGTVGTDIVIS